MHKPTRIILASTSTIRKTILNNAGVQFEAVKPPLDEDAAKVQLQGIPVDDWALRLARAKALSVQLAGDVIIIGCDQTLIENEKIFDKPKSVSDAREQLMELRGKQHKLVTAVVCARKGEILFENVTEAHLTMCNFSNDRLDRYLREAGEDVSSSVGGYKLEGPAIQLFEKIEGDYFSMLGLPLLPLLAFLRGEGIIPG